MPFQQLWRWAYNFLFWSINIIDYLNRSQNHEADLVLTKKPYWFACIFHKIYWGKIFTNILFSQLLSVCLLWDSLNSLKILRITVEPSLSSNLWSLFLSLQSAKIIGLNHHTTETMWFCCCVFHPRFYSFAIKSNF